MFKKNAYGNKRVIIHHARFAARVLSLVACTGVISLFFSLCAYANTTSPPPVAGVICPTPGATALDGTNQSILACLLDNTNMPGSYVWTKLYTTTLPQCVLPKVLQYNGQAFSCTIPGANGCSFACGATAGTCNGGATASSINDNGATTTWNCSGVPEPCSLQDSAGRSCGSTVGTCNGSSTASNVLDNGATTTWNCSGVSGQCSMTDTLGTPPACYLPGSEGGFTPVTGLNEQGSNDWQTCEINVDGTLVAAGFWMCPGPNLTQAPTISPPRNANCQFYGYDTGKYCSTSDSYTCNGGHWTVVRTTSSNCYVNDTDTIPTSTLQQACTSGGGTLVGGMPGETESGTP
jgi:hypothetical protein